VAEPELGPSQGGSEGGAAATADAEARMLALLNAARVRARLGPLAADEELRAVALAHGEDMARGHFFGHVSPTTGSPDDRIRRAGIAVSMGGENIAQAPTAELAHESLMDSPGHRANMLSAKFTHVGIAVVPDGDQLLATLVFARRGASSVARWTAKQALEAIGALRKARQVGPVVDDPVLQAAADAGIKTFARGGPPAAFAESNAALAREAARRGVSRRAGCVRLFEIVEPEQLEELTVLFDGRLKKIGLAVTTRSEGKASVLVLLVLTEGVGCK
jgi:uncharacterized protein YkwD